MTFHCQEEINREVPLSQGFDLRTPMGMMMTILMKMIRVRMTTAIRTLNLSQAPQRLIPRNLVGALNLRLLSSNSGLKHDLNVSASQANHRLQHQ